MELQLDGKVVIVTGGSKGIGRATALAMLAEGAAVLVCARGQEALDDTVAAAGAERRERIDALAADLTDAAAIARVVARCVARFGRVDILINNAGSARTGPFLELSDEAWISDWTLKFFGYVRMARAVIPPMERHGGGVIVNVIGAATLNPRASYTIGGAANAALNHFTKALAEEGAPRGVRVVGVNPGPILTERLRKMRAGFIHGANITIDGGLTKGLMG